MDTEHFICDDENTKEFKVIFDSGSVKSGRDVWILCCECNSKSVFRDHRTLTEKIERKN